WWYSIGWSGVDLFFVLSGFLIASLLFNEFKLTGGIDVRRFLIRRGFKIYPAFYSLIGLTALSSLIFTHHVPLRLLSDAFFLGNYLPHVWSHCWSLAIEEHFYLILPFVLLLMIRVSRATPNPFRAVPLISMGLTLTCLLLRLHTVHSNSLFDLVTRTHLRLDGLFFGVTLAYYGHFCEGGLSWKSRFPLWLVGVFFVLPVYLSGWSVFTLTVGLTSLFIGFGCILIWAMNSPILKRRPLSPFSYIGRHSYSIYLWHAVVAGVLAPQATIGALTLYLSTSLLLGIGLSKVIEMPALRVRDRIFASGNKTVAPSMPKAALAIGSTP